MAPCPAANMMPLDATATKPSRGRLEDVVGGFGLAVVSVCSSIGRGHGGSIVARVCSFQ